MHLRSVPPTPSDLWPDVPKALEDLLLAMLAKSAERRPSLETVAGTLLHVRDELDGRRSEPKPAPPRRHTRFASAPPLVPVGRRSQQRWQLTLGALAIVASGVLFLVARDSSTLAAAPDAILAPAVLHRGAVSATSGVSGVNSVSGVSDIRDIRDIRDIHDVRDVRDVARVSPPTLVPMSVAGPVPTRPILRQAVAAKPNPAAMGSASRHRPHHAGSAEPTRRTAMFDPDGSVESY
jgi:hypothetical protein